MSKLTLISFPTCPFVQRAVIALKQKGVDFEVQYVDLANKPDWFLALSPLGKVPVLKVERDGAEPAVIFESAVILEYIEETQPGQKLHPADPLERARHRSWMEFGSQVLGDLWRFTSAKTAEEVDAARPALRAKLARLEEVIAGPLFAGEALSLVDLVFAPAFRQIDALETLSPTGLYDGLPKVDAWRKALAAYPSVRDAVPTDFLDRYLGGLRERQSHLAAA